MSVCGERECTFTQASVREGEGAEGLAAAKRSEPGPKAGLQFCVLVTGTTKSMFASLDTSARSSLSRDEGSNEQRTPCQRRGDKKANVRVSLRTTEKCTPATSKAGGVHVRRVFRMLCKRKKFQFSTRCAETRDETQNARFRGHPLEKTSLTMLPAFAGPITGERSSPFAATPEGKGTAADKSGSVPWCSGDRVVGNSLADSVTLLLQARKNRDEERSQHTDISGLLEGQKRCVRATPRTRRGQGRG